MLSPFQPTERDVSQLLLACYESLASLYHQADVMSDTRLFGILQGRGVGVPNLLGVWRNEPEQVRESDVSTLQTPRDPVYFEVTQ